MPRVLVIEDNINNMDLITFILETNGCEVLKAYTGLEGVKRAVDDRPDFILLDIQLPDITGTEVLQLIRREHVCSAIPIIAVTSFAMAGDEERLLAAGCTGYIEKPINPEIVMDQIRRIVEKRP
ncbi:MAG TPA: response regulator [Kiritimatiellia bacterium]|nr:response regulator [Kiritimatiellia bacterium]